MAELPDDRPLFRMVMGCNGAGKSAWKRANYDALPRDYYDLDSLAGGLGDWNSDRVRDRALTLFNNALANHIRERSSFGVESTYSGRRGRDLATRMKSEGYRVEGFFIGTESSDINCTRVARRVAEFTGHYVDPDSIEQRWHWSLSNLRLTAEVFDFLEIVDGTEEMVSKEPFPKPQCELENGIVVSTAQPQDMASWCKNWLDRYERRRIAQEQDRTSTPRSRGTTRQRE